MRLQIVDVHSSGRVIHSSTWRTGGVCVQQQHIPAAVASIHNRAWAAAQLNGLHHQAVWEVDRGPDGQV